MDINARFNRIRTDFGKGKHYIEFEVDEDTKDILTSAISDVLDKELVLEIGEKKRKRSLNANAYFHLLVCKIADKTWASKHRVKNILLSRYGQSEFDEVTGSRLVISVKSELDEEMAEREDIHLSAIGRSYVSDAEFTHWAVLRGSHTYSTSEMSTLINGTVEEAKALGIATITPKEIERMVETWKNSKK